MHFKQAKYNKKYAKQKNSIYKPNVENALNETYVSR